MHRKLKQRLIILVVVLTLLIIFLPMIFSKRAEQTELMSSGDIPTPPEQSALEQKLQPPDENNSETLGQQTSDSQIGEGIKPKVSSRPTEQPDETAGQESQKAALSDKTTQEQSLNHADQETINHVAAKADEKNSMTSPEIASAKSVTKKTEKSVLSVMAKKAEEAKKTPILKTETGMENNTEVNGHPVLHENNLKSPVKTELKTLSGYKTRSKIQQTEGIKRLSKAKIHSQGWVVQLGSFSEVTYANQLIKSLRDEGFSAFGYYHTIKKNKIINRVYVGPFVQKPDAKKIRDYIAKKMNIRGLIVKFNPVQ